MKKWWVRISCLLLAMLLVATALPVFAADEEEEQAATIQTGSADEDVIKDYVILLDCSMSNAWTDEDKLSVQAYLNFLDQMPLTGARLTIISFGYQDANYYNAYSSFDVQSERDKELIHVLVNQQELSNSGIRDEYKNLITQVMEENRYNKQTWTPYAHALAAAVDLLEQNTDPNATRNACIILISDGILDDRAEGENEVGMDHVSAESTRLLEEASKAAGEHDWPIYSIHLNYGNKTDDSVKENTAKILDDLSSNGGWNEVDRVPVASADEVFLGLTSIFADFQKIKHVVYDLELPGAIDFEVEPLTSETVIGIFGEGIESIDLLRVDDSGNVIETYREGINSNIDEKRLIVAKGECYYSIKLVVPTEGKWQAYINGTGGANVKVSTSSLQEMNLNMVAEAAYQEDPLTKNNTVNIDANFEYREIPVDNNEAYNNMPATLKIYGYRDNGVKAIMTIEPEDPEYSTYCSTDKYGYHFQLPLNLFHNENAILVQVVVENSSFRDGVKNSNPVSFKFQDLSTECIKNDATALTAHVGEQFKLDMRDYFSNPDGDPVTYTLTCTNDPTVSFASAMNGEQLVIEAGLVPGEYQVTIGVQGESVVYDKLTLTVINDYPRLIGDNIPDMELLCDGYGFQHIEEQVNTVDLNSYFGDYEQMPLTYTVSASASDVLDWELVDGVLVLNWREGVEGDVTITVTAADGITPDSVATTSFNVSVISGIIVFWRDNWIYFAIALAILLIIAVVIILLLKNKRVKGEWNITFDDTGDVENIEQIDLLFTEQGKKGKFLLKDLMVNELSMYLSGGWDLKLSNYFSTEGADKLELVGVIGKKGCTVNKIPKNSNLVKVNSNGMDVSKNKVSLSSGTLTVIIEKNDGSGDRLTITMQLL